MYHYMENVPHNNSTVFLHEVDHFSRRNMIEKVYQLRTIKFVLRCKEKNNDAYCLSVKGEMGIAYTYPT